MSQTKKESFVLYKPVPDPEGIGYLDQKLVEFRNSRPPKLQEIPIMSWESLLAI